MSVGQKCVKLFVAVRIVTNCFPGLAFLLRCGAGGEL